MMSIGLPSSKENDLKEFNDSNSQQYPLIKENASKVLESIQWRHLVKRS